jgi:large repetitive protein
MKKFFFCALALAFLFLAACGGGGGGSSSFGGGSSTPPTPPPPLSITTPSILPSLLQGQPYSTTLAAANGQGALKWSIAPMPGNTTFVDGLTIDATTGVLSGTPTFQGTAGFVATVTDANSKVATQQFSVTAYGKLVVGSPFNGTVYQWTSGFFSNLLIQGGVPPFSTKVTAGALPPGVTMSSDGDFAGTPTQQGTFLATVTVSDSWSTPQTVPVVVNFTVSAPVLRVASTLEQRSFPVGRPISESVVAAGGVPPYGFAVASGTVPAGLNLDLKTGKVTGTPTSIGNDFFGVQVTDSAGTNAIGYVNFQIVNAKGRNDSIQTATPVSNGSIGATLSPYIDPPNLAPTPGDTDYYKLTSVSASVVQISTNGYGGGPIDTVIEVLDANGVRLNTCGDGSANPTTYASPCINDEDSSGTHNSRLSFKIAGPEGTATNSFIHVLDWSGNARPDMQYNLQISGNNDPINQNLAATFGVAYTHRIDLFQAQYPTSWSLFSGTLPPGIALAADGTLSGTPTTKGSYSFELKVTDSATPNRTFYVFVSMGVADAVSITSPAVLPTACNGKPYSFSVQTSGGTPPLIWGFTSFTSWPSNFDSSTGTFRGTPQSVGTFTGQVLVTDLAGFTDHQNVTLTVANCP